MKASLLLPGAAALALVLAAVAVPVVRHLALRIGLVDDPRAGDYKTHVRATPYGGGVAIWFGALLPLAAIVAWLAAARHDLLYDGKEWGSPWAPYSLFPLEPWSPTLLQASQVLCLVAGATVLLLVGLADDWRTLPAGVRLGIQVALALALALLVPGFRLAPAGGPEALGIAAAVVWIVALTNAFNFLDNMNGLAAGLAAICLVACASVALAAGHLPAAVLCVLMVGATAGFLLHNFPAASIFMGDAGGLFLGFVGGGMSVLLCQRLTLLASAPDGLPYRLAPLVVFAVPLYDLATVVCLRLRRGLAPWTADTNHVSHRLVAAGLDRTRAVLVLYGLAAATAFPGIAALGRGVTGAWAALGGAVLAVVLFGAVDLALARRRGP